MADWQWLSSLCVHFDNQIMMLYKKYLQFSFIDTQQVERRYFLPLTYYF
jgi:hypothetical protein